MYCTCTSLVQIAGIKLQDFILHFSGGECPFPDFLKFVFHIKEKINTFPIYKIPESATDSMLPILPMVLINWPAE